eukprot:TRINITY_DN25361_c0_g1_i1.p1 TRINITY_DN25361_c0_g1~~TRINITY_DN25361_c0_g1_i1.p1  ORF type:complete len:1083 (+),score=213.09 TRINITY_DN25361_c0_g1_i1:35-3250(+)
MRRAPTPSVRRETAVEEYSSLLDKHLRLQEDHQKLKNERNDQEEKMKQIVAKFHKVEQAMRKTGAPCDTPLDQPVLKKGGGRDIDTESYIALLQSQLRAAKKEAEALRAERDTLVKRLEKAKKAAQRTAWMRPPPMHPHHHAAEPARPSSPEAYLEQQRREGVRGRYVPDFIPTHDSTDTPSQTDPLPRIPVAAAWTQTPPLETLMKRLFPTPPVSLKVHQATSVTPPRSRATSVDVRPVKGGGKVDPSAYSTDGEESQPAQRAPAAQPQGLEFYQAYVERLQGLLETLRRKVEDCQAVIQQLHLEKQELQAQLTATTRERDDLLLAQRERQAEEEEVALLHRNIEEKASVLNQLHTRFQQVERQLLTISENKERILRGMEDLSSELSEERRKCSELERAAQLAKLGEQKAQDLASMTEELHREKQALFLEKERMEQQLLQQRGQMELLAVRQEYEDEVRTLSEKVQKWEVASKAQFKEMQQVEEKYASIRQEHENTLGRLAQIEAEHAQLHERAQRQDQQPPPRVPQQPASVQADLLPLLHTRHNPFERGVQCRLELPVNRSVQCDPIPVDRGTLAMSPRAPPQPPVQPPVPPAPQPNTEEIMQALALVLATQNLGGPPAAPLPVPPPQREVQIQAELEPPDTPPELRRTREENLALQRRVVDAVHAIEQAQQLTDAAERRAGRVRDLELNIEELRRAMVDTQERDAGLIRAQQERITELQQNVTALKHQLGTRVSVDSLPRSAVHDDENIIEVYVGRLQLEKPAAGGSVPSVFVAVDFLEHVTQATDCVADYSATFGKCFMYTVRMNEFLLYYLQHKNLELELHQRLSGLQFQSLAAGSLPLHPLLGAEMQFQSFIQLFTQQHERIGQVEVCLRLHKPLPPDWILPPFPAAGRVALSLEDAKVFDVTQRFTNVCGLIVTVFSCEHLRAYGNNPEAVVPYFFYSFYNFPDEVVDSVRNRTTSPQFNHSKKFLCRFDVAFIKYIFFGVLPIFVLNHLDEDENRYLGMVQIPLASLLEGPKSKVHNTFELRDPDGSPCGTINLVLFWSEDRPAPSLDSELALLQLQHRRGAN